MVRQVTRPGQAMSTQQTKSVIDTKPQDQTTVRRKNLVRRCNNFQENRESSYEVSSAIDICQN
jgi:hypothetical protein